ncbi:MAG: DUF2285 domain-containing protein [Hyphomicrobiaceae bacterium]
MNDLEHGAISARARVDVKSPVREFFLPRPPIRTHVHFDGFGRQIVTLESEICRATVIISGALVTLGPVDLQIGWIGLSDLAANVCRLNALAHLLMAQRYYGPIRRPAAVDGRHLRNAIIALDGERAGATRRQMATVIYGEKIVSDEWAAPSGRLKAMIKRDVVRGRRLSSGGWRDLVIAGSFRGIS